MALVKSDLEKLEAEIVVLKDALGKSEKKIRQTGGDKVKLWFFRLNSRIREIESKINDLKTGNVRVDKVSPGDKEIEKKVTQIETKLGVGKSKYL